MTSCLVITEGRIAFERREAMLHENPYIEGTDAYTCWKKGWLDAQDEEDNSTERTT